MHRAIWTYANRLFYKVDLYTAVKKQNDNMNALHCQSQEFYQE